jgi:anti-sigma-K factor RskA
MSDTEDDIPADDAAERALRLNAGADDAALAIRAETDPAFAAGVDAWNERFAPLYDEIEPVTAPLTVWPRVSAAIAAPRAANDNMATRFWRGWAMASTSFLAASLAGMAFLIANPRIEERIVEVPVAGETPAFQPVSVATLMSATDPDMPIATITYDPHTGALHVAPTMQMDMGETIPALWLVDGEGQTTLVGAVDPAHAETHSLPSDLRPTASGAMALAISLEPMGEPLAPQARGPVVAVGEVARL